MWRKLLKEIIILFRVAIWAGLGFLMWKGSRQPSWALVRKEDVRMWEIRSSKITPLGAEEMREKEAGVKSIFLLHCKGWEYSCLLLSTESSWRMSDVCAQQCKIRFCTSVHICMKPSKYTMQCVCQRYREKKEIAKKKVWLVESKGLPEMLWSDGVAFCLLSAAIKVDFPAYHLLQKLTFWGLFDIGRHGEKRWKPSCSSQVQTENVLGIPAPYWARINMLRVSVYLLFFSTSHKWIFFFFWV